jgi:hypothetical protein
MDPMRKVGYVMIVPGILMLLFMFIPFFIGMIPREGLPWTYTWSSVLGIFFFFSGFALLWITGGIRGKKGHR